MKKLIIMRLGTLVAWMLGMLITFLILILCKVHPEDISNDWWNKNFCLTAGMAALYITYFFAGKRFHDINIKKLILVFFIWTLLVLLMDAVFGIYLMYLSGSFICFTADVISMGITGNPYLAYIIGFFIEISVIVTSVLMGRISSGKSDGKHFVFLSKIMSVIIAIITSRFVRHIVVFFSDNPNVNFIAQEGLRLGWLISIITVGLWYFYVGVKCFRTQLKIVLPVYFLWDIIGVSVWRIFGIWDAVILCGGYNGFFSGLRGILPDSFLLPVCIGAFLLEALFLASGVLLGRHLDKKTKIV